MSPKFKTKVEWRGEYLDLVQAVALVCAAGDVDEARMISMREWDASRSLVDLPGPTRSGSICKALELNWGRVLAAAMSPSAERERITGYSDPRSSVPLTDEFLLDSIRMMAFLLGEVPSLRLYDANVITFESDRKRRFGREMGLPTSATITSRFGDWDSACRAALNEGPNADPPEPEMTTADWLEECIREIGGLPTQKYFREWTSHKNVRAGAHSVKWADLTEELKSRRVAEGRQWPLPIPRKKLPPVETLDPGTRRPRGKSFVREDALESLRRYARAFPPSTRLTQAHYQNTASVRPELDLPSLPGIQKFGKFPELLAEAMRSASIEDSQ